MLVNMVTTVYLDESEHAVAMLRGLKKMKREQNLCDFIIKVQGVEYPVHKNILSVGSPYFQAMLMPGTRASREGKVEIKKVDLECVNSCIDFLYTGNFEVPNGKIGQLLHAATILQLDKVISAISDIFSKSLSPKTLHETRIIAKMYQLESLSEKCDMYYKENLMEISSQSGFDNETKFHLINALKSGNLKLTEEEKLTVSLRWIGKSSDRKETLFEFFKLINLKEVPSEYLSGILDYHPVINNDIRLYKLINAAYVEKLKIDKKKATVEASEAMVLADNNKLIAAAYLEKLNKDEKKADVEASEAMIIAENNKDLVVLFDRDAQCLRSYDPATNKVTNFHDTNLTHLSSKFYSAVSMDSYIYVLCRNKTVYRLNFRDKNSKWERMQDLMDDHGYYPPVVSLSGSLFVIGGSTGDPTNVVSRFDPTTNCWLRLPEKPEAMCSATLVSLDDSIFCIGGWVRKRDSSELFDLRSFCRFTPSTSEWVNLEPMKEGRCWCGAVAVEQRIFAIGGLRGWRESPNEVECYDVASGHWTSLSPMIDRHDRCSAHYINGSIFLVEWRGLSDRIEKYDTANNKWSKVKFKDIQKFNVCSSVSIK